MSAKLAQQSLRRDDALVQAEMTHNGLIGADAMLRTGPHPEPSPLLPNDALASIGACLSVLLATRGTLDPNSPALVAFDRAMRRFGEQALELGGVGALEDLRLRLIDEAPDHAAARAAILRAVWANLLPGSSGRA